MKEKKKYTHKNFLFLPLLTIDAVVAEANEAVNILVFLSARHDNRFVAAATKIIGLQLGKFSSTRL